MPYRLPRPKFISRGGHEFLGKKSMFERWNDLPYGVWLTHTGRLVLFNRFYEPLLERTHTGEIRDADATEWVLEIARQSWFYGDDTRTEIAKRKAAKAALDAFRKGTLVP